MPTNIAIERLTPGTMIYLPDLCWGGMTSRFNACVEVIDIEFDGYGYALTLDGDEAHYVDAGEEVQFGGVGEPVLRDEKHIPQDEWTAKADAKLLTLDDVMADLAQPLMAAE